MVGSTSTMNHGSLGQSRAALVRVLGRPKAFDVAVALADCYSYLFILSNFHLSYWKSITSTAPNML